MSNPEAAGEPGPPKEAVEGEAAPESLAVNESATPSDPAPAADVAPTETPAVDATATTATDAAAAGTTEGAPQSTETPATTEKDEAPPADEPNTAEPAKETVTLITDDDIVRDKQTQLKLVVGKEQPFTPEEETLVVVTVEPPQGVARQPSDLVCVIDVSGSMSNEATIQGAGGSTESHGLSLLDVAKHGVRTIIKTLDQKDRLSIIKFNFTSAVELALTTMDEDGQKAAEEALDRMDAMGGTNIWAGLESGLEQLREHREPGRFGHIMLLTDGESTERESIVPNLEKYKAQYEKLPGTISTFGFGYRLDSNLLVNLADSGSGSYSFIPDAGFVGTAFVHTMSNLLVTMGCDAMLILEAENGSEIQKNAENTFSGGFPLIPSDQSKTVVNLGTLQYGQSKDIVVPIKIKDAKDSFLVASLQYKTRVGEKVEVAFVEGNADTPCDVQAVEEQSCRCLFADALKELVALAKQGKYEGDDGAKVKLEQLINKVAASPACEKPKIVALLEDMRGQTSEAFSKQEYFTKWGVHYLPSLMFAHRLEQCNNFKDPGVQVYGGKVFETTRDIADDKFNELPAPKPSRQRPSVSYTAPVNMSMYNDRYGG